MKKRIAILTGGGDVPGLNAAIKSLVWRLDGEHEVIGLRRGGRVAAAHRPVSAGRSRLGMTGRPLPHPTQSRLRIQFHP